METFAASCIEAFGNLSKRDQNDLRKNFAPHWQTVCLISCGWFKPDFLTDKGIAELNKLADELGVGPCGL